jgi:hypothetical protein
VTFTRAQVGHRRNQNQTGDFARRRRTRRRRRLAQRQTNRFFSHASPSSARIRSTSNQAVPSTACRRAAPIEHEQDGSQPTNQSSSASQAPDDDGTHRIRITFTSIQPSTAAAAAASPLLPVPRPTPNSSEAAVSSWRPAHLFHGITPDPQPTSQQGWVPKKHKQFYSAHIARQLYTQGPARPTKD